MKTQGEKICEWIIAIGFIAMILLLFAGCGTTRAMRKCAKCPKETIIKDSVYTQVKDTTIYKDSLVQIPADSAWYFALIECVNNKPVIKSERTKQGASTKFTAVHKSDSTGIQIKVDCETEKKELAIKLKMQYTKEFTKSMQSKTVTITVPVNYLKWWQKVLMWCGGISLIYAGFRIGFFIAKKQVPFLKFLGCLLLSFIFYRW